LVVFGPEEVVHLARHHHQHDDGAALPVASIGLQAIPAA
jgi:hypothetical protein